MSKKKKKNEQKKVILIEKMRTRLTPPVFTVMQY